MEVVIVAGAGRRRRRRRRGDRPACCARPGAGARAGDRQLAARGLPPVLDRASTGQAPSASPTPAPCCSTSTSGCRSDHPEAYRAIIRRALADARRPATSARLFGPDVWADDVRPPAHATSGCSASSAASTCSCSASVPTATSASTSPARRSGRAPRIKTLTEATRRDNARFFTTLDDVPRHVVTQGLATILDARHVAARRDGSGQGGTDRPRRRGTADGDVPGIGAAAAPPRHGRRRRGRRLELAPRRLLPLGLRRQAALAAPVSLRLESWYVPAARRGAGRCACASSTPGRTAVDAGFALTFTTVDPARPARPCRARRAGRRAATSSPRRPACGSSPARAGSSSPRAGTGPDTPTTARQSAYVTARADGSIRPVRTGADRARARPAGGGTDVPARPRRTACWHAVAERGPAAASRASHRCSSPTGEHVVHARPRPGARRRRRTSCTPAPPTCTCPPARRSRCSGRSPVVARAPHGPATHAGRPAPPRCTSGAGCTSTSPGSSSRPPTSPG